jgi:aspergillopepsin I
MPHVSISAPFLLPDLGSSLSAAPRLTKHRFVPLPLPLFSTDMTLLSKAVAALAGLSIVASAAPAISPGDKFSVCQVTRQRVKAVNVAAVYAKAIAKHGGQVPVALQAAAQTGTVTTTPIPYDEEYVTPVTIGSGTLELDFDTGSADL